MELKETLGSKVGVGPIHAVVIPLSQKKFKYVLKPMARSNFITQDHLLLLLIAPLSLTRREAYRFVEGVINSGPPRMFVFALL